MNDRIFRSQEMPNGTNFNSPYKKIYFKKYYMRQEAIITKKI